MELDSWQALQGVPGILVGIKGMDSTETASGPVDKGAVTLSQDHGKAT